MATYIMLGRYSVEGIKGVSKERTKLVVDEIKKKGGKVDAMYATLGNYDLCFIVHFQKFQKQQESDLEHFRQLQQRNLTNSRIKNKNFKNLIKNLKTKI
ncbi:MAG: hypothetical protein CVT88_08125 [Candidatus Altiarchaeales archaeon HGW-Altiarchaeales-1]|nr:MAG: hypothetical protein CVT88_08125 [Candidatus Altiarchaeales archaeon HGW-Altiarchaeales-1]